MIALHVRTRNRARRPSVAVALAVVMSMGLAGCSPPEYRYVTNSAAKTYLKVPRAWKSYSGIQVFDAEMKIASEQSGQVQPSDLDREIVKARQWRMVFDSDPAPSLLHAVNLQATNPVVDVSVVSLGPDDRNKVSNESLRNLVLGYDGLKKAAEDEEKLRPLGAPGLLKSFRSIIDEEVQRPGGIRGVRTMFEFRGEDQAAYIYHQIALVDARNSRLYVLAVRAAERAYFDNVEVLDEVIDSFTVKQKA